VLEDEAEGLARGAHGGPQGPPSGAERCVTFVAHCRTATHAARRMPHTTARTAAQTDYTMDSLQHHIVTACVAVPCTHVTVAARAQRRVFHPLRLGAHPRAHTTQHGWGAKYRPDAGYI
jgi:hypothetical protein